jgi:tetratricopeptide (TPR) repeat protein
MVLTRFMVASIIAVLLGFAAPGAADTYDAADLSNLRALRDRALAEGAYNVALPITQRLQAAEKQRLGASRRSVLDDLMTVGTLQFLAGNMSSAQSTFETLLARDHGLPPDVLRHYRGHAAHALALVYQAQGRPEAIALFRDALAYAREIAPVGHVNVQVAQNNLANVLLQAGEIEEAVALLEELRDAAPGDGASYGTVTLSNLAHAYVASGRFSVAERQLALTQRMLGREARDGATKSTAFIFDDVSDGQPVDCSNFRGGTGPVNPDPATGGEMAQCGPFGTRPTFGGWGDWGDGSGGGPDPCPACPPCPICGGSGGGTPDPDPDPDGCEGPDADIKCLIDEIVWACDLCYMEDDDRLNKCAGILFPPALATSSSGTPFSVNSLTSTKRPDPLRRSRVAWMQPCLDDAQRKLDQCLAAAATPVMDCDDAYELDEILRDLRD